MKFIMENWKLHTESLIATRVIPSAVEIASIYFKAKDLANKKYFILDSEINKIKDPEKKREAQDNKGYKLEAFQHILASFAIKHKYPNLPVEKLGQILEIIQKKLKDDYDEDDKARDLKNNDIGIKLANKYKDRKIKNFEDFINTTDGVIKDGKFYTTSTTSDGELRTYNSLLSYRDTIKKGKDKEKETLPAGAPL